MSESSAPALESIASKEMAPLAESITSEEMAPEEMAPPEVDRASAGVDRVRGDGIGVLVACWPRRAGVLVALKYDFVRRHTGSVPELRRCSRTEERKKMHMWDTHNPI
jgi:hypothetical protein